MPERCASHASAAFGPEVLRRVALGARLLGDRHAAGLYGRATALRDFPGLPHRLEFVGDRRGVRVGDARRGAGAVQVREAGRGQERGLT